MKRFSYFLIIALLSLSQCSHKVKPYKVGLVNFLRGNVTIIAKNGNESKAVIGMPVDVGMSVRTGADSICEIYFNDNVIKLMGDTDFTVKHLTYNMKEKRDESSFFLSNGEIFTRVKKKLFKDDVFLVKTPTVVAAVRGTDFFISGDKNKSTVSCLEGKVEVVNPKEKQKKSVILSDDEESHSSASNTPTSSVIEKQRIETLSKSSSVTPVTKSNAAVFEKLEKGDQSAISRIKLNINHLNGSSSSDNSETDDPDINLFFFKSK